MTRTALALLLVPGMLGAQHPAQNYEQRYAELMSLRPLDRTAAVSNVVLTRDVARFTLASGTLHLLSAVGGRTVGVVFRGGGTFSFSPPTEIERGRLARFEGAPTLEAPFTELVLLFADSTLAELERRLSFTGASFPDVAPLVRRSLEFLGNDDAKSFDPDLMAAFLNGDSSDLFYAHVERSRGGPVMFMLNPFEVEEITLAKRSPRWTFSREPEVICRFPRGAAHRSATTGDRRATARISDYRMNVALTPDFTGDLKFAATARVTVTGDDPLGPWVTFDLYPELDVDSARWEDGTPVTVFRGQQREHGWPLWIRLDRRLAAGETRPLTLYYQGNLIDRFGEFFYIKASTGWYPLSLEGRSYATFDNTFHVPSHYRIASVGARTDSSRANRVFTTRWVTTQPIRNASFNVGPFDDYRVAEMGYPPVSVMLSEHAHRALAAALLKEGNTAGLVQRRMKETVGQDVLQSLKFFHRVYGPAPVPELFATEIPGWHGEAFPGLVHLSWATFHQTDQQGADEVFRAHEVAHQWWGIGVDFDTYHDQWLSEGLANFSGLWYLHAARRSSEKYFALLRRWRGDILRRRDDPTPISLGYRARSSKDPEAYQVLIYNKGAWVMHMLRILMLELGTAKEDRFTAMMQEFYGEYRGRRASTQDFQRVVERHRGAGMDWFFKQWVHGTQIPEYRVAYRTEPAENGQYRVTLRVEQRNVSDDFQMPVPVTVALKDNRQGRFRVNIKGPRTEVTLPLLPAEPKGVTFNDLEGVLAEVKMVDW